MEKTERKADQFVHTLLTEGAEITCDDSSEAFKDHDNVPLFYDEKLFKSGQSFYHANSFAIFGCKIFGLMSVLFIPTILRILVHTKKSGSEFAAYRRYMATIFHMVAWYESDFKPGSRLWRSITEVKNMHNSASKSGCKVGLKISQKDMALTQFGFMGYQLSRSEFVGMQNVSDEEWKGFIHLWRVVGYLLGIEDRFNVCRESVEETRAICEKLIQKVFIPEIKQMNPESLSMIKFLINGLWVLQPMLNFNVLICRLWSVITNKKNYKEVKGFKTLTFWEKCIFYFLIFAFYSTKWAPFRWYFNYTRKRDLWLIRNFPFLAYYKFGFKNACVQILSRTK